MKRPIKLWDIYMFVVTMISLAFWGSSGSGMAAIILFGFLWLIGAPFKFTSWASNRLNSRPCPVCGNRVPNGQTQCGSCGTDFRLR